MMMQTALGGSVFEAKWSIRSRRLGPQPQRLPRTRRTYPEYPYLSQCPLSPTPPVSMSAYFWNQHDRGAKPDAATQRAELMLVTSPGTFRGKRDVSAVGKGFPSVVNTQICTITQADGVFTLQNTGPVAGHEVSQLYLSFPVAYGQPPKILRGFARTFLEPGERRKVSVGLRVKDVSVWDVVGQEWVRVKGEVGVFVGASSRDLRLSGVMRV
ncbi:fibronectin type III-like domain-containing protein [Favolaschia claudopus]|uniref:beta-glucosidase n=1 Tax=Favolaschia claudopus TaxID=2862362 RepID=A0AAW0DSN6_9AGAR